MDTVLVIAGVVDTVYRNRTIAQLVSENQVTPEGGEMIEVEIDNTVYGPFTYADEIFTNPG